MKYETPITDTDLHAYLDGQLSDRRRLQVEAWLKHHPDKLRELNEYQDIDQKLHELLDPVLKEAVPEALRIVPRRHLFGRVAAAAGFLLVGGMIGWQTKTVVVESPGQFLQTNLIRPASFAHFVYTSEQKHPVEVTASHEQHLINWLSKRLHTRIMAPNLLQHGYELVGGRLLPSTDKMAAQFMYQKQNGKRVTLYVRRINNIKDDTAFQLSRQGNINTFYWIEGKLGYALSGELARDKLMAMARTSYRQLKQHI